MLDYVDADTLYADIMLMSQVDNRIVILVEGQEDVALIDPHLDENSCRSEICHGKRAVLHVAQLCMVNSLAEVFAAVDRDFDDEATILAYSTRISISEYYDLQSDIYNNCGGSLERVLYSHVDRDAYRADIAALNMSALELAVEIVGPLGAVRKLSVKENLSLALSKFPIAKLVEAHKNDKLHEETILYAVIRSKEATVDQTQLGTLMAEVLVGLPSLHYVCNGHDLDSVIASLIRERWGGAASIGAEGVSRSMRSSVDWECLQRLHICQDFRRWAEQLGTKVWRRDGEPD